MPVACSEHVLAQVLQSLKKSPGRELGVDQRVWRPGVVVGMDGDGVIGACDAGGADLIEEGDINAGQ